MRAASCLIGFHLGIQNWWGAASGVAALSVGWLLHRMDIKDVSHSTVDSHTPVRPDEDL